MEGAYIGDFFDIIPGFISQACRHLHGTEFEVIERIYRRLAGSLYLVNHLVSRACAAVIRWGWKAYTIPTSRLCSLRLISVV